MRMPARSTLAGAVGAVLLALYAWPSGEPAPAPVLEKPEPDLFAFVGSMQGTRPDGHLTVAAGQALVVDAELGYLFDYYLAGLGEKPLADIRARIELELDQRLPPVAAQEARRLLAAYLAYRQALAAAEQALPAGAQPLQAARTRLQTMRQLRASYFTAQESAGLFGAADAHDDDALARLEVVGDASLDDAGRAQRLAALDRQLTPAQRAAREAPLQVSRLDEAVRALRAQGGGDNEVYRLRASTVSPEAAARLAELDREEAQWQQRLLAWQSQKAQLGVQDPAHHADALQRLRDASFTPDEQRRLGADD